MAEKLRDAVAKFVTYRNVQRHRAVFPATARLLVELRTRAASIGLFHKNGARPTKLT